MPQGRDLLGDLVPGQLAALAGLRSLGELDLQFLGRRQIGRRDAEAPDATCLITELRVPNRPGSSPPSPEFDMAPIVFIARPASRAPPGQGSE